MWRGGAIPRSKLSDTFPHEIRTWPPFSLMQVYGAGRTRAYHWAAPRPPQPRPGSRGLSSRTLMASPNRPRAMLNPRLQYYNSPTVSNCSAGVYRSAYILSLRQNRNRKWRKVDPYTVQWATSDKSQTVNKGFIMRMRLHHSVWSVERRGVLSTSRSCFL